MPIKATQRTYFCNNISQTQNQKMLNCGSIKALSACKRCPFEVLLTPF